MVLAQIPLSASEADKKGVKMKGNSLLAMIAILPIVASCGKSGPEIFGSPKTKSRLGVIAKCTSPKQAAAVASALGGKYRVINAQRKIVEFYGIDQATLTAELPKAKFTSNEIYESLVEAQSKSQNASASNVQFYGPHTPEYRDNTTSDYFPHLEQISGDTFTDNIEGENVTIAVVDTGVYYNHPHLSPNIKFKTSEGHGELANGQDDDGNGLQDDYVGWDFYNHDAYPVDDHGHGTHVAGLAAGTLGGIAPKAKILPIKVLGADGSGDLATIAAGVLYAVENGADIVNLSLGGPSAGKMTADLKKLINVVKIANENNVMIVAAAGNGGEDGVGDCNDDSPIYPANIDSPNVISVAAVDAYNHITDYSNYGGNTVHVAAPGGDYYTGGLISTGVSNCPGPCTEEDAFYYASTGTSMATPVVAGLIALIKSATNLSAKDIKKIIMDSGMADQSLAGIIQSGKVINVKNALAAAIN